MWLTTGFFTVFTVVFLLVLLVSTVITFILPESYASTARIKVEHDAPPTSGQFYSDPNFVQTEFEVIQSQMMLNRVIDKLNLNAAWGKKYVAGRTLETSQTLEILKQRLQLAPVRNTSLIAITVYSDDRNEAAQIANAIADAYRDYRVRARADLAAKGLQVLKNNYQAQEQEIPKSQADLVGLQKKFGLPDRVEDLKAQALNMQKSYHEMDVQLALLHSLNLNKLRDVLPQVVQDAALNNLLGKLEDAEQKYNALTNDYPPSNVAVMRVSALMDELNHEIDDREKGMMAGLETQAASTKAAADTLSTLVEKAKPSQETKPYWDAKHDLEQLIESHKLLFARIETEKLEAQIPKPTLVQITDMAEPGRAPVKPNKPLNIFIGAVAGGFLGLVAGTISALAAAKFGKHGPRNAAPA